MYVNGPAQDRVKIPRMEGYPAHLARERRLADGRTVLIRPMRKDEASGAREARIDYDRHMAFVGEARADDGDRLVGEARYAPSADGRSCDFDMSVADGWNGSGVGILLLDALMRFAHAHGFESMSGLVPPGNADLLRYMKALGFESQEAQDSVRVTKKL